MKIVLSRISLEALDRTKKRSKKQKLNAFSQNVTHWAIACSLEISLQITYLISAIKLDENSVNIISGILDKKMDKWTRELIIANIDVINQKMKLLKDEKT